MVLGSLPLARQISVALAVAGFLDSLRKSARSREIANPQNAGRYFIRRRVKAGPRRLTPAASQYLFRSNPYISNIPHIMIQSSRLRSLLLSALLALPSVAEPLLPGSLRAAEEKKIEFPAASQRAVVKQRVGLTDVEVDYSRPNRNDREIFGGLVPYGKLWRTGANAPTKIKFSDTVTLGGKE